jgi:hypothetical protein
MAKIEEALKEQPKAFAQVLDSLEDGDLHRELSRVMQEMNNDLGSMAAANGGAKGEIKLTLKFIHDKNGTVQIASDLSTKMPKASRTKSMMWLLPSGNLANENPRQTKLPLRTVQAEAAREAPQLAAETKRL